MLISFSNNGVSIFYIEKNNGHSYGAYIDTSEPIRNKNVEHLYLCFSTTII